MIAPLLLLHDGLKKKFTPRSIANCLVWLRSDLGITLNGSTVSAWADQSGNGNNFTQGTALQQPTYSSSDAQYGNKPSLSFDGSNDTLMSGSLTYGPFTIFTVARMTSFALRYFFARDPSALPSEYLYGHTNATIFINRSGTQSAKNLSASWGLTATPRSLMVTFDGTHAGHKLSINGSDQSLTSAISNNPGTATVSQPMNLFSDNASLFSVGTMSEFIIYSRALTTTEIEQVHAYLRGRYNHY